MKKSVEKAETVSEEKIISTNKKCCGGMWGKLIALVVIILIALVAYYGWFAFKPKTDSQIDKATEQQVLAIVSEVSDLMVLPEGELPQVAEIKDAELASVEQPFLAGSVDGDILLVYADAGKAIVYSPKRNLIVNVGPVQVGNQEQPVQPVDDIDNTSDDEVGEEE